MMTTLSPLNAATARDQLDALSTLLIDSVADGAAISFLHPLSRDDARAFWQNDVLPEVATGRRLLFGAFDEDSLVGTVQLLTAMPQNQPHRAEIAKMMVHPFARRRGLGRALILAALDHARTLNKSLVTLDTRSDDIAQSLYASVGFEVAGIIPGFGIDPDRQNLHPTTYMYKTL